MSEIILIGDVHGKTHIYQKMLRQKYEGKRTIQLGDMGIGFSGVGLHEMTENHKWFRGNHDDPAKCRANKNYLGDWGFLPEDSLFWTAGAFSIDRMYRIEGISWWSDEELSYQQLDEVIQAYTSAKPKFVISHEAPANAAKVMLQSLMGDYFAAKGACTMSRTAEALQQMFEAHQPEKWIFGHYHVDKTFQYAGTEFTCVAELSQYVLNTEDK